MGRPRKPDALKQAQGNPGKRRLVDPPPAAAPAPGARRAPSRAAPKNLSPTARKTWARVTEYLAPMQFIRLQDREALSRYCEHLALWWGLKAKVSVRAIVQKTRSRHVTMDRLDKGFLALMMIDKRLVELEDRYGLNPRARQQIMAQIANLGTRHPGADLFGQGDPAQPTLPAADGDPDAASPIGCLASAARVH